MLNQEQYKKDTLKAIRKIGEQLERNNKLLEDLITLNHRYQTGTTLDHSFFENREIPVQIVELSKYEEEVVDIRKAVADE